MTRLLQRFSVSFLAFACLLAVSPAPSLAEPPPVPATGAVEPVARSVEPDRQAETLLRALDGANFRAKARAITAVAASGDPRAGTWLQAMLDGTLRVGPEGAMVLVLSEQGSDVTVRPALEPGNPASETTVSKHRLKRIALNNSLRTHLTRAIALVGFGAIESPRARQDAARSFVGSIDEALAPLIVALIAQEPHDGVRTQLERALAVFQLESGDVRALDALADTLHPAVRGAVARAAASDDPAIAVPAGKLMADIERRERLNSVFQTIFFGLSMGSVLVLAAIGLAITFGVMGVINMAHGELIMLGAYTTWAMQQLLPGLPGLAVLLAIPAAFLVSAGVGVLIERGVIRHLKGRALETLLATFGISLILQQAVRVFISPQNRPIVVPEFMSGAISLNEGLSLTLTRVYVMVFAVAVFAALMLIMKKTRLGLHVRAVTQNRAMARAMGIRATRVDIMTFALGSGVAGLAGVALAMIANVGPNLGQSYIVDSFMVVVFGGVGNLWGTLIGGLSLGVLNQTLEPWVGSVEAKVLILVFIILFIQMRPRGLFPQRGRAAES